MIRAIKILGYGYYWEGEDALSELSVAERDIVLTLAREAAKRLSVPFLAVDIGQQEDGQWWVIEVGDAQFAGRAQTPLYPLWEAIARCCSVNRRTVV